MRKKAAAAETRSDSFRGASPRLPSRIFHAAAALWCGFCLVNFLRGRPIPFDQPYFMNLPPARTFTPAMASRTAPLLMKLLFFWAAAWSAGRPLLGALIPGEFDRYEGAAFSLGLGAGALGFIAFALGLSGWARPGAFAASAAALCLLGAARTLRAGRRPLGRNADERAFPFPAPEGSGLPLLALAFFGAYNLLFALAPVTFYDSLVYHLSLPELYLLRGRMGPVPRNIYAGLPAGVDLLYLWALALGGGGTLCQLLHWSLGLLDAGILALLGRRWGNTAGGFWAAAVFFTNPMVINSDVKPGAEMGWTFFQALALLALATKERMEDPRWLALAGALAGLALGTKYQAAVLLPALWIPLSMATGLRAGSRAWLRVSVVAAVVASPWIIKNWAFYHNPVYPFLDSKQFESHGLVLNNALFGLAPSRPADVLASWSGFLGFARREWDWFFPGPGGVLDNDPSLIYVMVLPLFLACRLGKPILALLAFAVAWWLPMDLMTHTPRYAIPALVPLSLAAALPACDLFRPSGFWTRAAAGAVFVLNGLLAYSQPDMPALWSSLKGDAAAREYLSHNHPIYPCPPYPVFRWANEHLPKDAKVLVIGEARTFYLERDWDGASDFALQPIVSYVNASSSADDLVRRLREEGITHVLINVSEIARQRLRFPFTPDGPRILKGLWDAYLDELVADRQPEPPDQRYCVLYRLRSPEEARAPHRAPQFPFISAG